jgi:hypothetical protein
MLLNASSVKHAVVTLRVAFECDRSINGSNETELDSDIYAYQSTNTSRLYCTKIL